MNITYTYWEWFYPRRINFFYMCESYLFHCGPFGYRPPDVYPEMVSWLRKASKSFDCSQTSNKTALPIIPLWALLEPCGPYSGQIWFKVVYGWRRQEFRRLVVGYPENILCLYFWAERHARSVEVKPSLHPCNRVCCSLAIRREEFLACAYFSSFLTQSRRSGNGNNISISRHATAAKANNMRENEKTPIWRGLMDDRLTCGKILLKFYWVP